MLELLLPAAVKAKAAITNKKNKKAKCVVRVFIKLPANLVHALGEHGEVFDIHRPAHVADDDGVGARVAAQRHRGGIFIACNFGAGKQVQKKVAAKTLV